MIRDTRQVFATYVEEGPNEHGLQKDALVPWLVLESNVEDVRCLLGRWLNRP